MQCLKKSSTTRKLIIHLFIYKKGFLDIFTSGKKENFSNILEILNDQNTLLDIQETFDSYSNICKEELSKMPDNQYKDALYDIVINLDSRLT